MSEWTPPTVLIATSNPGKRAEFAALLPNHVTVIGLEEVDVTLPPEDGTTFAEIAAGKAIAAAKQTGLLSVADDSGLEVESLNGAPGLRSARYAGEPASDERNREALLHVMSELPDDQRTARFRCAVAIAGPGGLIGTVEGTCEGRITRTRRGSHGFGYDPIFELADGRTMAELTRSEKSEVSHRGQAFRKARPMLERELRSVLELGDRS